MTAGIRHSTFGTLWCLGRKSGAKDGSNERTDLFDSHGRVGQQAAIEHGTS